MTDIYVPEGYVLMPIEPTPHMLDVLGTTANNSWNRSEWYANLIQAGRLATAISLHDKSNTMHSWKLVSVGEYDTLYECEKCNKTFTQSADYTNRNKPEFGCGAEV